jgi:hypothetical protein
MFMVQATGVHVMKPFLFVTSKEESLSGLVKYFLARPEPTNAEPLTVTALNDRLLALPTHIRPGWESEPRSTTLAYFASSSDKCLTLS